MRAVSGQEGHPSDIRDTVAEPRVGDLVDDDIDEAPVACDQCCGPRERRER